MRIELYFARLSDGLIGLIIICYHGFRFQLCNGAVKFSGLRKYFEMS